MHGTWWTIGLLFGLIMSGACPAEDLKLIEDGRSEYVIVLPPEAGPPERWAAEELASHFKQMSGADLKVHSEGDAVPEKAVIIGLGPAAEAAGVKADASLGTDGFVIRTVGPKLVIAGGRPRGTLYGVYTLLESLGVRWWYVDATTVPTAKTVTVPSTDRREIPKLEYRDMMFNECYSPAGRLWMARNKVNGLAWEDKDDARKLGGRYRFVGNLVHSYTRLLEQSGHEITDEMKALVNGQRTFSQPCLSNPKTLGAMVDGVLKAFQESPDAGFVVVGQMDNDNYCRCPDCAAIDRQEESHAGQVIRFANRVAEEVEKRRPGSCITTAAYQWSRKPPKTLRPRDNVFITLCSIECDFAHPLAAASNPENKAFKDDIEGWSRIARKIIIWHYVGNRDHYLMPNPELDTLTANMRFFADNRAAGIFNQGTHRGVATDMAQLKMWVLARSMWAPESDGRALIEEFCRGYYGPAAQSILKYIDIMHQTGRQRDFHLGRRVSLAAPFLKPEILAEAEAALRQADAAVADQPELARRVRHARMGVWYVLAKRGPATPTWQAVESRVGKLDLKQIAANLRHVADEFNMNCIDDPDPLAPWLDWLTRYAARAEEGLCVPPELADRKPGTFRIIQACQMDARPGWWQPTEGASDGWAAHVPGPGWYQKVALSPTEDFSPGRKYRLFVRAKGMLDPAATGQVWEFGVHPRGAAMKVSADQLKDGRWHVFEIGPWEPTAGQYWWTAMIRGAGKSAVAIDCIWLSPVE